MKGRTVLKRQTRMLSAGYRAVPNQRNTFTSQANAGFSHGDMMSLPTEVAALPYNPDGSRKFLLGYSVLGGEDALG